MQLDAESGAAGGTNGGGDGKAWGAAERIHVQGTDTAVAFDSGGNAVMVWRERRLTLSDWEIWSNLYAAGGAWDTAVRVDTSQAGDVGAPAVAVDPNGNAVAVWDQPDGSRFDLWSSRYRAAAGEWDAPQLIENDDAGDTFRPRVAIDPRGNALAVWQQSDGTRDNIWANRYTLGSGWGIAKRIEANNNASGASHPQIAVDSEGNAFAVWQQSDGARDNIWASRYTPVGRWEVAERIEVDNAGGAAAPDVALAATGHAVAVWRQSDGTRNSIWANHFEPGVGWGAAVLIEDDDEGDALHPRVAMDANGNAVAVWDQFDGLSYDVWSNRYTAGSGWGAAERIEENDAGEAVRPHIAVDPEGNAVAIWEQFDGSIHGIWSNRFTNSAGWGSAQRIDERTDHVRHPDLAIAPNGNALAVWNVSAGWSHPEHGIWGNHLE